MAGADVTPKPFPSCYSTCNSWWSLWMLYSDFLGTAAGPWMGPSSGPLIPPLMGPSTPPSMGPSGGEGAADVGLGSFPLVRRYAT